MWLGVNALNAAFMEYTSVTAAAGGLASVGHGFATIANGLAAVIYFIFGYKGCILMIEYLAKRK
jgi:3-oxoacyl-(acyl-carrier-protein) synthase